jgi:hypothetical protein
MTMTKFATIVAATVFAALSQSTHAQKFGQVKAVFNIDGRTVSFVPASTPHVKAQRSDMRPRRVASFRNEQRDGTIDGARATEILIAMMQDGLKEVGVEAVFENGSNRAVYISTCGRNGTPPCDAKTSGIRHSESERKVYLKDVVLVRESSSADPKDTLILNGVLSYPQ